MALSPAKRKSNDRYLQAHYAKLTVAYPREYVERIKAAAAARGESIAGFVKAAIDARIATSGKNPPDHDSE